MSKQDNGGQAFPCSDGMSVDFGMYLRDYFAAKAMQGALAAGPTTINAVVRSGRNRHGEHLTPDEALAFAVYDMADAMVKAREE